MPGTTIDMLRHGQPLGGNLLRGQQDDPLSEAGWADMRHCLGEAATWDAVVSSPLLRCADFARDHARRLGMAVEFEPRFRELHFGRWEGCDRDALLATDGDRLRAFWDDPAQHTPPGGETLAQLRERVLAGWDDLLEEHRGARVLLVTHAGVIRVIIAHVLSVPPSAHYRIDVPMARISRVRVDGRRGRSVPRLLFHGACTACP